jgi:hypothetical protein
MPWEYLLSAATRSEGRTVPLLVTRLFDNNAPDRMPPLPKKILVVVSNPGRIGEDYEFDSECERIQAAVRDADMTTIVGPPPDQLPASFRGVFDVIHVTGVDTHQAPQCAPGIYEALEENEPAIWAKMIGKAGRLKDGIIMREDNVAELPVAYPDFAKALINPQSPPSVVTLNLNHSGARTAREMVRLGAHSALGFLDEVDDEVAEAFFQAFYWAWCGPNHLMGAPQAFVEAWQKTNDGHLHGTAIVIWMGRSVFELFKVSRQQRSAPKAVKETRQKKITRLANRPVGELLQVEFYVEPEVNYSLLHNDRELITKLTLTKLVSDDLEDITVHVELNVGNESYPYRFTHPVLNEPQYHLAADVKIPLTADLPRSLAERVRSTVYIKVTCGGRTAFEDTQRVTLIPVDEWVDDTKSNPWLPSFVLPRDPAILDVIKSSRKFLIGITDDPAAGFIGYQGSAKDVDNQVRAIWTALVNDYRPQYIVPPPAYSERGQRLRTPAEVLGSGSGTCIDLTLLLASCLEYIEIHPVLVLQTAHAFVGYWRSDEAHDRFVGLGTIPDAVPEVGSSVGRTSAVPYVDGYGWRLGPLNYEEIMAYVDSGDLKFLEATFLTGSNGFKSALATGEKTMRVSEDFDSLLDIRLARTADPPVTPLPILSARVGRT